MSELSLDDVLNGLPNMQVLKVCTRSDTAASVWVYRQRGKNTFPGFDGTGKEGAIYRLRITGKILTPKMIEDLEMPATMVLAGNNILAVPELMLKARDYIQLDRAALGITKAIALEPYEPIVPPCEWLDANEWEVAEVLNDPPVGAVVYKRNNGNATSPQALYSAQFEQHFLLNGENAFTDISEHRILPTNHLIGVVYEWIRQSIGGVGFPNSFPTAPAKPE